MLRTLEATIERDGKVKFKEPVKVQPQQKVLVTFLEDSEAPVAFLSEQALAVDWLKPKEEQAWSHLQKGQ